MLLKMECFRRSPKNIRRISGGLELGARHAGHGAVPVSAELHGERGRGRGWGWRRCGRHEARRGAGQGPAAAHAAQRHLQRRGEPARLRREPRRLLRYRKTLRDELLRLPGDHHQN